MRARAEGAARIVPVSSLPRSFQARMVLLGIIHAARTVTGGMDARQEHAGKTAEPRRNLHQSRYGTQLIAPDKAF